MIFETKASLKGDTVTIEAKTRIKMTDFGLEPPSILGMLTVEEDVQIYVSLVATKQ